MSNKKFETLDGINSQGDVTISGNVQVNSNTLFVDSTNGRIGVNKSNPTTDLDVDGNITATNVNAQFFGDGSNITNVDAVTLGSLAETQFLRSDVADTFTGTSLTVENSNTSFQSASKVNLFNGTPLRFGTLPNPSATLTFANTGAQTGKLELKTSGTIDVIVDNALTVNGTVTATAFSGDGSNLTNVATNLGTTATATTRTVTSSTGTNATLPAATTSLAGVMTAADKTKLNGIETSATADQTAAEIRSLVESATNSNVFTDADHTKLNGIAANAQTGTVTSVGSGTGLTGGPITTSGTLSVDSTVVRTSDNQTIAGVKTFTSNTSINANTIIASSSCLFITGEEFPNASAGLIAASIGSDMTRPNRFGSLEQNSIIASRDSDIQLINYSGDGQVRNSTIISSRLSNIQDLNVGGQSAARWTHGSLLGSSIYSTIRGQYNTVLSSYDVDLGINTDGAYRSAIIGSYEAEVTSSDTVMVSSLYTKSNDAYSLVLGYGSSPASTSNRTILLQANTGDISIAGTLSSSTTFSDFVEFFENGVGTEIEPGTIVTLKDNFVYPANEGDEIAGVVSHTGVINAGDSPFHWQGKYLTDHWGRFIYEEKTVEVELGDGEIIEETLMFKKVNPNWDPEQEQISRKDRPDEWTRVGLLGQVRVKVNSTVKPNDKLKSAQDGIGTISTEKTGLKCIKLLREYDHTLDYAVALCVINIQV